MEVRREDAVKHIRNLLHAQPYICIDIDTDRYIDERERERERARERD